MATSSISVGPGFDPNVFFAACDFWEELISQVAANENEYLMDYGKGVRKYKQHFYKISIRLFNREHFFMVADEIISEEEQKLLEPFCSCLACSGCTTYCSCCLGCLKNPSPSQEVIKHARGKARPELYWVAVWSGTKLFNKSSQEQKEKEN